MNETTGSLDRLRVTALTAALAGAVGSLALWIHAAQRPPVSIIILFVFWVLSPFVILAIAHGFAKRWRPGTQVALYLAMLFVTVASLAIYVDDAVAHRTSHRAFVYVAVPPASVLLTAVAVGIGGLLSRKRNQA